MGAFPEDHQGDRVREPGERPPIQLTAEFRETRGARHDEEVGSGEFLTYTMRATRRRLQPVHDPVDDPMPSYSEVSCEFRSGTVGA